jgi:hypothetical protein
MVSPQPYKVAKRRAEVTRHIAFNPPVFHLHQAKRENRKVRIIGGAIFSATQQTFGKELFVGGIIGGARPQSGNE